VPSPNKRTKEFAAPVDQTYE
jgi:chromosome segregation ATPase